MNWVNQNLGFINTNGFTVPVNINENFVGEAITLSDDDLEEDDVIEDKYAYD
jgi:hypothetical protein